MQVIPEEVTGPGRSDRITFMNTPLNNNADNSANPSGSISDEARTVLKGWLADRAIPELSRAYRQRSSWFRLLVHYWIPESDGRGHVRFVRISNAQAMAVLARQVGVIAAEIGYSLDEAHDDCPCVPDATVSEEEGGERQLTQREVVEFVAIKATTTLKEVEVLKAERAFREERKALRATLANTH